MSSRLGQEKTRAISEAVDILLVRVEKALLKTKEDLNLNVDPVLGVLARHICIIIGCFIVVGLFTWWGLYGTEKDVPLSLLAEKEIR